MDMCTSHYCCSSAANSYTDSPEPPPLMERELVSPPEFIVHRVFIVLPQKALHRLIRTWTPERLHRVAVDIGILDNTI